MRVYIGWLHSIFFTSKFDKPPFQLVHRIIIHVFVTKIQVALKISSLVTCLKLKSPFLSICFFLQQFNKLKPQIFPHICATYFFHISFHMFSHANVQMFSKWLGTRSSMDFLTRCRSSSSLSWAASSKAWRFRRVWW